MRCSTCSRGPACPQSWRLEELQRLTRATTPALRDLQTAGLIAIVETTVRHDPLAGRAIAQTTPLALTAAQARALATITAARAAGSQPGLPAAWHHWQRQDRDLLAGAGGGRWRVGERGIVLVPEIALTPQAMERYAGRFPGRVALLHSGLSDAERLDEWRRIRAGEVDVVLGSRSALFAPVERLGLIVVDEEHEGAYKQDRRPTYHARDVAVRLGALTGATVVLGSATPSVESYWRAQAGAYTLVELRERAPAGGSRSAPSDGAAAGHAGRSAGGAARGQHEHSERHAACGADETLERGEQAILFLNRRGMASSVVCRECGYVVRCRTAMSR